MRIDSTARAAVLSGALVVSAPDVLEPRIHVPAIRLVVPRQRPPLNLDAAIFRYRVDANGNVTVVDEPAGARVCADRRHRR